MFSTLSRNYLEPSFQDSKNISGKTLDPKAPVRLLFPGGWKNQSSRVFKWYNAQKYTGFRKLHYYKERQGVGHEFIVLPLVDVEGNPTKWSCRLERTADPSQQLAAIGFDGTEAFDYVKSSDDSIRGLTQGSKLVAETTFPRTFDLYDVLAICSGISEHPKARRYTLQQFNCYFFSWTIVLLLARRAVDWENIFLQRLGVIQGAILGSVVTPTPDEHIKLAYVLSSFYDSDPSPPTSFLRDTLAIELSSHEFSESTAQSLSSVLWVHRAQTQLSAALKVRSTGVAEKTLELFVGGLDVEPDHKLDCSLRGAIDLGPGLDAQEYALEGVVLYSRAVTGLAVPYVRERRRILRRQHDKKRNGLGPGQSSGFRIPSWATIRRSATSTRAAFPVLPFAIARAFETAGLHDKMAVHQKKSWAARMMKYPVNTLRYLPENLLIFVTATPALVSIFLMELEEEENFRSETDVTRSLHGLNLAVAKLLQKIPDRNENIIRGVIFQLMISISKRFVGLDDMSPKEIWECLLWDFLRDIVGRSIFKEVVSEQPNEIEFQSSHLSMIKNSWQNELGLKLTPTVRLQQFIQERIVRQSKHDIDHAPIVQYIPLPAMPPALESQEQMRTALEEIWCTVNLRKRFKE